MQQIQKDFEDVFVFNGIGCFDGTFSFQLKPDSKPFDGTFSFQLKPDSKPYQVPLRCMVYALQKPFWEELERLQKQDLIQGCHI